MSTKNRDAARAHAELVRTWQSAISCFGHGKVISSSGPDATRKLLVNHDGHMQLRCQGRHPMSVYGSMWYRVVRGSNGGYTTAPLEYIYALHVSGKAVLAYHWHPRSTLHTPYPHAHYYTGDGGRRHIPTGFMRLADLLLYAEDELGAIPLRKGWRSQHPVATSLRTPGPRWHLL